MERDILIVDDDRDLRELLKFALRKMGLSFREASDGLEALEQIHTRLPGLIILDMMMPGMDGITVLKKLGADPDTRNIPVVLFTAYNLSSDHTNLLQVQPSMILRKGTLSIDQLAEMVETALQTVP